MDVFVGSNGETVLDPDPVIRAGCSSGAGLREGNAETAVSTPNGIERDPPSGA